MDRTTYNGGSMTNYMGRDFQLLIHDRLEQLDLNPYTPSLNKEINDKETLGNEDIAKKIVAKDSEGIINSNVRLFNNLQTTGTSIEIGQVLGMNDFANIIKQLIEKREEEGYDLRSILDEVWCVCHSELDKDFILFDVDVRSHNEPESGYRRSTGYHQYQRGVGMRLMENEDGYLTLDNAMKKLKEIRNTPHEDVFQVKFDENNNLKLEKGLTEMIEESEKSIDME